MFVPGAIAATSAPMVISAPAELAEDPLGATYTTIGILALSISFIMVLVVVTTPPGVSMRIITQAALCSSAV